MTTNNPQPQPQPMEQPMEQPQVEQTPMEEVPTEQPSEMGQGGQVQEQYQEDPDKIVLSWGLVFTFFK